MQEIPDRDNCAREPIHIPGAIQPHGILLVFDPANGQILQVSENCREHLRQTPEAILSTSIQSLLAEESAEILLRALKVDDLRKVNPMPLALRAEGGQRFFDGIIHRNEAGLILELEPQETRSSIAFSSYYHSARESILSLQNTRTIDAACNAIVEQIRRISGYDRVKLYKFDAEWNGNVIAESGSGRMESYLGQRFPASDIPAQARQLYTLNLIRLIVDANYRPAALIPAVNPRTGGPIDLSYSTLRSVSPVHLEYLRNMPTLSSMSISVLKDDKLWGLICCHHMTPRFVSYETRSSCELLGQFFAYQLSALESREDLALRQDLRDIVVRFGQKSQDFEDVHDAFLDGSDLILSLARATGAALILRNKITLVGQTPDREQIPALMRRLRSDFQKDFYVSHELARAYPEWAEFKDVATGVLAINLTDAFDSFLLWFRPELIQTVRWAGNPEKDTRHLSPRKSFELWVEQVRGQAEPFDAASIHAALELRNLIVLRQLSKVNADLRTSNSDLDEFGQIISHDLREPLRGIRSYAKFALEDDGPQLSDKTRTRLQSIVSLSQHMDDLTSGLFQYSRLGRYQSAIVQADLHEIVAGVLFRLQNFIEEHKVEVIQPRRLPQIACSPVRVGEIFHNLISNAIKYNASERKTVTISFSGDDKSPVFFVQDNGIGIDAGQHESIFKIFRRLHSHAEYGGGTGAGLAIVKKLVESHHGRIWLESTPGGGSTFFFTLQAQTNSGAGPA